MIARGFKPNRDLIDQLLSKSKVLLLEVGDCVLPRKILDAFWSQRGGMNPVEVMDKLGSRLRLLHQKDIGKKANPVNLFEAIPEGTNVTYDVFYPIGSITTDFVEVGTGIMDIPAIVKKAQELDSVKYIIIEQDQTTLKELESVKIGFDALSKMIG